VARVLPLGVAVVLSSGSSRFSSPILGARSPPARRRDKGWGKEFRVELTSDDFLRGFCCARRADRVSFLRSTALPGKKACGYGQGRVTEIAEARQRRITSGDFPAADLLASTVELPRLATEQHYRAAVREGTDRGQRVSSCREA